MPWLKHGLGLVADDGDAAPEGDVLHVVAVEHAEMLDLDIEVFLAGAAYLLGLLGVLGVLEHVHEEARPEAGHPLVRDRPALGVELAHLLEYRGNVGVLSEAPSLRRDSMCSKARDFCPKAP
jgi:hypothetical protein